MTKQTKPKLCGDCREIKQCFNATYPDAFGMRKRGTCWRCKLSGEKVNPLRYACTLGVGR